MKEEGKRLRGVREGGKAKEGKRRGRKEGREREFGPPTFQMLPPPMAFSNNSSLGVMHRYAVDKE